MAYEVVRRRMEYDGALVRVRVDTVVQPDGSRAEREVAEHADSVAIVAVDDRQRVLLIRQYRHPAGQYLWGLPAGLCDKPGEPPLGTAQRELAEEADLRAGRWDTLIDWVLSPGGTSEAFRCYLARGVSPVPDAERHTREGEEQDMPAAWFGLDEVRDAVLAGRLHNPSLVVGVLTACAARDAGWSTLRPADAAWPEHPAFR